VNKEDFINDKMQMSPYNYDPKVVGNFKLPKKLTLCDATLREGAQGTVIGFTLDEKMEILRKSAEAGIGSFQIGVSMYNAADMKEMVKRLKAENIQVQTEMLGGAQYIKGDMAWKDELNRQLDVGLSCIDILTLLTPYSAAMNRGASSDEVIGFMGEQISYLVGKGATVSFDPMDGPRTDFDILMKAYETAVSAGAQKIRLLDSVGTASPATWRYLVSQVRAKFPNVQLGVHCHNDYGQAMANVYASIECGVDFVDVCINGLGERAGNAALAEVAAGAAILYGVDTGVKLDKMYELSALVGDIAKYPPQRNQPIVGNWVFGHGDEGHVMLKQYSPWCFEGVKAEVFGNDQPILLGAMSGPATTKEKLAELGFPTVDNVAINAIFAEVKHETIIRKAILSDGIIRRIAMKHLNK
jgi:isopropylmalate/homocitrate/citramalate synthase